MNFTNSKIPRTKPQTQQHRHQAIFTNLEASKLHFQHGGPFRRAHIGPLTRVMARKIKE